MDPTPRAALTCLLIVCGACGHPPGATVRVVDLISQFGHADARPSSGSFQVTEHTLGERGRASIAAPVPSRITWTVTLPRRSSLHVAAAVHGLHGPATVTLRIGVSDNRIYESLLERVVTAPAPASDGWIPLTADLSPYAGPKLSLFYRPDRHTWHIVLAVDTIDGRAAAAYWAEPGIDTDADAARRYFRQRSNP